MARALEARQSSRDGSLTARTTSLQIVSASGADAKGEGHLQDRVCIDKVQVGLRGMRPRFRAVHRRQE